MIWLLYLIGIDSLKVLWGRQQERDSQWADFYGQ
jgi:hypothetical protein